MDKRKPFFLLPLVEFASTKFQNHELLEKHIYYYYKFWQFYPWLKSTGPHKSI